MPATGFSARLQIDRSALLWERRKSRQLHEIFRRFVATRVAPTVGDVRYRYLASVIPTPIPAIASNTAHVRITPQKRPGEIPAWRDNP
jgi:hypothetical protein